jgi:hypothetical protein
MRENMALSFERFQQNFKGHPVPEALKELLLFQNSVNDWYSGSFNDIVQQARLQHPALKQWIDTLVPASRKEK